MVMAKQAQQFPVAAIFRVVGMVVIDMVNREFTQIGDKLASSVHTPMDRFLMLFRDSRFPVARSFWGSKPLPVLPAMKRVGILYPIMERNDEPLNSVNLFESFR
jgi:hypothetical protein